MIQLQRALQARQGVQALLLGQDGHDQHVRSERPQGRELPKARWAVDQHGVILVGHLLKGVPQGEDRADLAADLGLGERKGDVGGDQVQAMRFAGRREGLILHGNRIYRLVERHVADPQPPGKAGLRIEIHQEDPASGLSELISNVAREARLPSASSMVEHRRCLHRPHHNAGPFLPVRTGAVRPTWSPQRNRACRSESGSTVLGAGRGEVHIPKSEIRDDPRPALQPDGKEPFRFRVDTSVWEPEAGDITAWPGGDWGITVIESLGVWVQAGR